MRLTSHRPWRLPAPGPALQDRYHSGRRILYSIQNLPPYPIRKSKPIRKNEQNHDTYCNAESLC